MEKATDVLIDEIRDLVDSNLETARQVFVIDGLDEAVYDYCKTLMKAGMAYYTLKRNLEDFDEY